LGVGKTALVKFLQYPEKHPVIRCDYDDLFIKSKFEHMCEGTCDTNTIVLIDNVIKSELNAVRERIDYLVKRVYKALVVVSANVSCNRFDVCWQYPILNKCQIEGVVRRVLLNRGGKFTATVRSIIGDSQGGDVRHVFMQLQCNLVHSMDVFRKNMLRSVWNRTITCDDDLDSDVLFENVPYWVHDIHTLASLAGVFSTCSVLKNYQPLVCKLHDTPFRFERQPKTLTTGSKNHKKHVSLRDIRPMRYDAFVFLKELVEKLVATHRIVDLGELLKYHANVKQMKQLLHVADCKLSRQTTLYLKSMY